MVNLETGIWATEVAGNTIGQYVIALLAFTIAVVALKVIKNVIISRVAGAVERSKTRIDDAVVDIFQTVRPPFYIFLAFYGATQALTITGLPEKILMIILLIWVTWQVVAALLVLLDHLVLKRLADAEDVDHRAVSGIVGGLAKIVLWIVAILFILSNLGVNINSLLAGVGIGGLALALAARGLLEDLFSSLAIFFDRPFTPGDFIKVGKDTGTVQKVGIKTTRIKTPGGEEIVIPNKDLTGARIHNYKRMQERRVAFDLVISQKTPLALNENISGMIQKIVEEQEHARFGWVYLTDVVDDRRIFEVMYHVTTSDFEEHMQTRQAILFGTLSAFEKEGVILANPDITTWGK